MNKILCALLLVSFAFPAAAQNIKDETIEYTYIKLPNQPLDRNIKSYQSTVSAPYEAENEKKKAEYEAEKKKAEEEYKKEMDAYPAKVKAAEDAYNVEMAAWKKKSVGDKIIEKQVLGEDNKPVKNVPSQPYKRHVSEPQLRTSYDYPVLASTYVVLDGFENKAENAVNIHVTMYGFDYTQPQQKTLQKNITSVANGQSTTRPVTYYYTEFTYRHPMSVKVITPDGKEIMNTTPQEMNNYKTYKSAETDKPQQFDPQALIKQHEEKILQENLKMLNDLVNDKIGYQRTKRQAELNYVKSKDDTYKDLLVAYNDASAGLKILLDDPASAKTKLESAVQAWDAALKESDPKNKKARIDRGVTIALCFNLLEGYFALGSTTNVDNVITTLNGLDLSNSDRKKKEAYEALFIDFKKRVQNNK